MASTSLNAEVYLWFGYTPLQAPAIFAAIMFLLIGIANLVITIRTKKWFVMFIPLTAAMETTGYIFRLIMMHHPGMTPYILMQVLLVVSPVFLTLVDYKAVGHLLRVANLRGGCLRPAWISRVFLASDVLCLVIQSGGAGMTSSDNPQTLKMAKNLLLVGLALQLSFFGIFTCITIYVNLSRKYCLRGVSQYKPCFWCLYATIIPLFIRNFYRVIEFSAGVNGDIATHESYLYVFDFTMVWLAMLFFTVWHFGFYLQPAAGVPVQQQSIAGKTDATASAIQVNASSGVPPRSVYVDPQQPQNSNSAGTV